MVRILVSATPAEVLDRVHPRPPADRSMCAHSSCIPISKYRSSRHYPPHADGQQRIDSHGQEPIVTLTKAQLLTNYRPNGREFVLPVCTFFFCIADSLHDFPLLYIWFVLHNHFIV